MTIPMTDDQARIRRLLARRDPRLAVVIKRCNAGPAYPRRIEHFAALVRVITGQQLSTKAAQTIYTRVAAFFPEAVPTPSGFAPVTDEQLRAAGLSRQKISYLRDFCVKVSDGTLRLPDLEQMPDDDVIQAIMQVKGLGRWSAEMFLMFRLNRPDVLPVGDLGIVKAMQRCYGLRKPPTPERMLKIGEAWRPYRSIACWYLWRSLENEPV
ncbi:MAG: DNA-3-methyladenine glycosylase family protein [Vicinamibacterales bacterium]